MDRSEHPTPPKIQAVDHVNIEVPPGAEEVLDRFYCALLGLPRLDAPGDEAVRAYGTRRLRINFIVRPAPRINPHHRRCVLEVDSLADCRRRLDDARWNYEEYSGLSFTERRLRVDDPCGHRIELKQFHPF